MLATATRYETLHTRYLLALEREHAAWRRCLVKLTDEHLREAYELGRLTEAALQEWKKWRSAP